MTKAASALFHGPIFLVPVTFFRIYVRKNKIKPELHGTIKRRPQKIISSVTQPLSTMRLVFVRKSADEL